ncbi:MAG: hypothetical protein AAGD07_13345 [Planctomycetota bacterium]
MAITVTSQTVNVIIQGQEQISQFNLPKLVDPISDLHTHRRVITTCHLSGATAR